MVITIRKGVALSRLSTHKERHIEEYKQQMEGYKKQMDEYGEATKEWVKAGAAPEGKPKEPSRPTNHLKQYQDYIQKLEYHALETIQVDAREFDEIINDNFYWASNWMMNNATYQAGEASRRAPIYTLGNPLGTASINTASLSGSKISGLAVDGLGLPADHVEVE